MITSESRSLKSQDRAEISRTQGNKCYVEKKFFDALVKYNESLCYADNGSETLGLAYANRSAVYCELKFYNRSLKNIDLARSNGYPSKNFNILDTRAQKCLEKIRVGAEAEKATSPLDFLKLTYESNSSISNISNCLELKTNNKFGRHVVTNRDLKVGDVIATEQPFFKIIKSDSRYDCCEDTNRYQRCAFCLRSNFLDLIPCETCSSTMFCSEKCLTEAKKAYHSYECPINDILLTSGVMQMAMRIFFQSLAMFNGSINDLEKFFKENEGMSASVFDFNSTDKDDRVTARNNLISLLCLARNDTNNTVDSPEKFFKIQPQLSHIWERKESFVRKFILRTLEAGDCNFHGICGWSVKKFASKIPQMIGIGCYPFMSLINHSCAPNINRIYVDDKMLLMVERPVKKGEQLFDCYKQTFYIQSKIERQLQLLNSYGFTCDCIACTNNFPLFNRLQSIDKSTFKVAKNGQRELTKMNKSQAKQRFKEYCDIIQNHHEKAFPSTEIVLLQECVSQCISIAIKSTIVFP